MQYFRNVYNYLHYKSWGKKKIRPTPLCRELITADPATCLTQTVEKHTIYIYLTIILYIPNPVLVLKFNRCALYIYSFMGFPLDIGRDGFHRDVLLTILLFRKLRTDRLRDACEQ